ncbi:arf-GAP with dual PH domain-containing protein 1-like [Rhincodon typus]|uniref:arf-GAP with dual PH domain-containing protein 1-like n=1 Tax=Rhincodon typus TaxID=259920 RepID=UPI00202F2545|nr:arf-GAP with dual PH domain-containing protein 1-like [Rhincodon typus]
MPTEKERVFRALKDLVQKPGNGICADCQLPEPEWASTTLGIFICLKCSGIHRNIPDVSKVKSLILDPWDDSQIQFMAQHGNEAAKEKYEAYVPIYYYVPTYTDCQCKPVQDHAPSSAGNTLETKHDGSEFHKAANPNRHSTAVPKECRTVGGNQEESAKIRSGFTGLNVVAMEIVDWFNAIRAVQFHYLQVAFPGTSDHELKHKLTRNFLKEGYMEKTGPKQTEGFKKRWFTLDHRRLMYYKDPLDAFAKGEVFVGSSDNGYLVKEGLCPGAQSSPGWQYGITVVTPDRDFLFTCEKESEQQEWIAAFNSVISQEMSPQEYTMEANFKHRR